MTYRNEVDVTCIKAEEVFGSFRSGFFATVRITDGNPSSNVMIQVPVEQGIYNLINESNGKGVSAQLYCDPETLSRAYRKELGNPARLDDAHLIVPCIPVGSLR